MARWECKLPSLRQIFDDINLLIKCLSVNYSASKRNSILRRRTRHSKCHPQQRLSCVGVIRKSPLQSAFRLKLLGLGRILSVKSIEYHGILKLIRFCSKQWIRVGIWYAIIKLRPHNLWMFPILTRRRGVLMQIPLVWACVSTRNQDYFIEEPPPATPQ